MQSPAILVISLVLVLAAAAGVGSLCFYKAAAIAEPVQTGIPGLDQRLSSLEDILEGRPSGSRRPKSRAPAIGDPGGE